MKQGLVKFFQKLLVYFWGKKHKHVSPHFYTTLTRVLHDPMFIGLFQVFLNFYQQASKVCRRK